MGHCLEISSPGWYRNTDAIDVVVTVVVVVVIDVVDVDVVVVVVIVAVVVVITLSAPKAKSIDLPRHFTPLRRKLHEIIYHVIRSDPRELEPISTSNI